MSSAAGIPQFYAGRCVFITGATGFMGKVLVERLLWTCPDVQRLYLLMRTKKGSPPEKRLEQLKQSPVFDVLRRSAPLQLSKLHAIAGDVTRPRLGLSEDSMIELRNVSIVFHSAATLKFDEALKVAVDQNVRSVIRLLEICDELPQMEALIHVSTAYSNADRECVEERVYPSPVPVSELLQLADSAPPHLMAEITQRYIAPKPNTYTFTKAAAECAIQEHKGRNYAKAIFRPSIVISSMRTPFPGWIENLNGPSGVAVAAGKGLLHVFNCWKTARADLMPVDIAIDTLIAVGWETAIDSHPDPRVYNCTSSSSATSWAAFETALRRCARTAPMDHALWYPSGVVVEHKYVARALQLLLQTVPLHAAEYAKQLFGVKTQISLIVAEKRMRAMSDVLTFFTTHQWRFDNGHVAALRARLGEQDRKVYNLDVSSIDWEVMYETFFMGCKKYLLKEKEQDLEAAKRHMRRMCYLHYGVLVTIIALVVKLLLKNYYLKDFVYGILRILASFFYTGYSHVMKGVV